MRDRAASAVRPPAAAVDAAADASGILAGRTVALAGRGVAADYAAHLLASLGAEAPPRTGDCAAPIHPDFAWARSGAMALSGPASGRPRLAPGPLPACADGALMAFRGLAASTPGGLDGTLPAHEPLSGAALLAERAACLGLGRRGRISPGGACRLIRARDEWLAVSLAREDDIELLPAWLGEGATTDAWRFVRERAADQPAGALVDRARLLGLPAAVAGAPPSVAPPWIRRSVAGRRGARDLRGAPTVVDLSALWAGPLCTHLLARVGGRVIKVESPRRPDGARFGSPHFYDLYNAGKQSVALDLATPRGREQLLRLVRAADVVVESARPRALDQLGIDAEALAAELPGLTWMSLTGYGRTGRGANWVAFGDDAGVAAGLSRAIAGDTAAPIFWGDAIADPLTGLHAALAALAGWLSGGAGLLELSLHDVSAHAQGFPSPTREASVRRRRGIAAGETAWEVALAGRSEPVAMPRARRPSGRARPLGRDTDAVLGELAPRC